MIREATVVILLFLLVGCGKAPETGPANSLPKSDAVPSLTSFSPASGSGLNAVFTETFTSPAGPGDILSAQVVVSNTLVPRHSCFFGYDKTRNEFLLLKDEGDGWLPTGVVPGSGSVQNGQCTLLGQDSSVVTSGSNVTLTYHIQFKPSFSGDKTIWTNAYSVSSGKGSPWVSKAGDRELTWQVK